MKEHVLFGAVKPEGWLKDELQKDMSGCIGRLDELLPDLLVKHDIYGADRLKATSRPVKLGIFSLDEEKLDEQFEDILTCALMWWNSESQSNWRDGWCRAALLLGGSEWQEKVKQYIQKILATQDEDGYLGIYDQSLRFTHKGENGELWAQSSLFRGLLAYYEATGEEQVLTAVKRGLDVIMAGYAKDESEPFNVTDDSHGLCHGLTIVDSFNRMYELTGEDKYSEYAVWLYEEYSKVSSCEPDMKSPALENHEHIWKGHGVHIYEHMRAVLLAADRFPEKYGHLRHLVLAKLSYYLLPSGAGMGDEFVLERTADATDTGYEYCSVQELLDTYSLLLRQTGDITWGDKMEWLYYNAAHGMKHPTESSIMYLKTDNCYSVEKKRQPDDFNIDGRYSYSPTHQKSAVCCVPNMGRVTPYFIQSMYCYSPVGIDAVLFGPGVFKGRWNGAEIEIRQVTDYPGNLDISFEISVSKPVRFSLGIRKPAWATGVTTQPLMETVGAKMLIEKEWSGTQTVKVAFDCEIAAKTDLRQDVYLTRGPLLYALPIAARQTVLQELEVKPFRELGFTPISREMETYGIHEDDRPQFAYGGVRENWKEQKIKGVFRQGDETIEKEMVPLGGTILRKATFKAMAKQVII